MKRWKESNLNLLEITTLTVATSMENATTCSNNGNIKKSEKNKIKSYRFILMIKRKVATVTIG